jgi:hypothetical protein
MQNCFTTEAEYTDVQWDYCRHITGICRRGRYSCRFRIGLYAVCLLNQSRVQGRRNVSTADFTVVVKKYRVHKICPFLRHSSGYDATVNGLISTIAQGYTSRDFNSCLPFSGFRILTTSCMFRKQLTYLLTHLLTYLLLDGGDSFLRS